MNSAHGQLAREKATNDRYRGALLGLAVGDALGTTLEFTSIGPHGLSDIVGGGPFHLEAGRWTDDTSMALCLAASLLECGFDPRDQMERYVRWWREGYMSSTGRCFDIGNTTSSALRRFISGGNPYVGSTDPRSAGNGSIMRLAPVPMRYGFSAVEAIERAADSSRTTHGCASAVDACRYMAGVIVGALTGVAKEELLASGYCPLRDGWEQQPLCKDIDEIARGSFKRREPPEIRGSGHVVRSLEAALWAFDRSFTFEEGALMAVNLGEDADTTGAVYGQIAGAYYEESGIPGRWLAKLHMRDEMGEMAERLLEAARR